MKDHSKIILSILFLLIANSIAFTQPHTEWIQRYNSPGNLNEDLIDMVLDKDGNTYITGNVGSPSDIITLKYSSSGNLLWSRTYNGSANRGDEAVKINVDDSGFVYVVGDSFNYIEFNNYLTIKYSSAGDIIWIRELENNDSTGDIPCDMVLDDSGNIYITGSGNSCAICPSDYITIKYDRNGNLLWKKLYHGEGYFSNIGWTLTIDKLNRVIVSGMSADINNTYYNATVIYNTNGDVVRIVKIDSAEVRRLDTDDLYNFYIGGNKSSTSSPVNSDIFLNKYDSSGILIWSRMYGNNTTVNRNDYLTWLQLDQANKNIYITGLSDLNNQSGWDFSLLKYNSSGDSIWISGYSPVNNSDNQAIHMTVDKFNCSYITGCANYNTPYYRFLTVKYDSSGNLIWSANYINYLFANHIAKRVALDSANSVYIGGTSYDPATNSNDIVLIKYSQITDINQFSMGIPKEITLFQNYPNPFNANTKIKYSITMNSNVEINVYNILGSKIEELEKTFKNAGTYEINFNAEKLSSGIYFYSMSINGMEMDKKKIILIK